MIRVSELNVPFSKRKTNIPAMDFLSCYAIAVSRISLETFNVT